jgi:N-ethylmaleimide reductase
MDITKNWSDQINIGEIQLKNRVCLAALTRQRCDPKDGIATDLLVEYYKQRSGAGMILT